MEDSVTTSTSILVTTSFLLSLLLVGTSAALVWLAFPHSRIERTRNTKGYWRGINLRRLIAGVGLAGATFLILLATRWIVPQ